MDKTKNIIKKKISSNVPPGVVEQFSDGNLNYFLITCSQPTEDGKMDVEMSCEGDPVLVSYLVSNAKEILENQLEQEAPENVSKRSCL